MDAALMILLESQSTPVGLAAKADMVLECGRWAAAAFQRYDRKRTLAIAAAVAEAAHAKASEYAERTVAETGFGIAAHKTLKNQLSSQRLVAHYRDWDFVNPRIDEARKIVEIPRPVGVIFALVPSTSPISTIYFKVLCALMTRNAIVVSPHPAAREVSVDAVRMLAEAATEAGAPAGAVQVIEQPTQPLIDQFMHSVKTNVILATGGGAMVRAACGSSNPGIGGSPGNVPVYVDPSAKPRRTAEMIVASKSFDNSVLSTNESVLFCLRAKQRSLEVELKRAGCHICTEEETAKVRSYLFHERAFNEQALGRDANWIAGQAGIRVSSKTTVLVTPIALIGVDEPLSFAKLCPVLGFYGASSKGQALTQARALVRLGGAGHAAAIHAADPEIISRFADAVLVGRVVVNAPCSQGAAGFDTPLDPTITVGAGLPGRSSIGDTIGPQHLISWTRIAWQNDDAGRLDLGGAAPACPCR